MKVFIDGDTLAYAAAASVQKDADGDRLRYALGRLRDSIQSILNDCNASEYWLFLSDDTRNVFRKVLYSEYKATRPQEKPDLLLDCRKYMQDTWNAKVIPGLEADDAVCIYQTRSGHSGIIAGIDKDLRQCPGRHYSWRDRSTVVVSSEDGNRKLYTQALSGDRTDNIPGLPRVSDEYAKARVLGPQAKRGVGPVTSDRILAGAVSEQELYELTLEAYTDFYQDQAEQKLTEQMNLVYLIREYDEQLRAITLWTPPHTRNTQPSLKFLDSINRSQ